MKQWFRNVWAAMRGRVPANADVAVDVGRIIEARNRSERAAQQAVDARVAVASEFPGFLAALESVRIALDQVPSKINVTLTGTSEPYQAMKRWVDKATESHEFLRKEREDMATREREMLQRWKAQANEQRQTIERLTALVERVASPVYYTTDVPSVLAAEQLNAGDVVTTAGTRLRPGEMPDINDMLAGHPWRPSSEAVVHERMFRNGNANRD